MWIAFKNYYLRDTTQHIRDKEKLTASCELLSKIIIFVTRHNYRKFYLFWLHVVNCFQKLLSSWHDTTCWVSFFWKPLLWIAFKNYYLRDTTQLITFVTLTIPGCELLSKIIIFVTRHNYQESEKMGWSVVNCFQKLLSSWHDTTKEIILYWRTQLWIAFKNYYLRDTTQHLNREKNLRAGCELLSKIIIFVTRHNMSA